MRFKEADFKSSAEGESGSTFAEYLNNMNTPGEWGGEPEVQAMSQILECTIVCIIRGATFSTFYSTSRCPRAIKF
jgi:hypothetical protein